MNSSINQIANHPEIIDDGLVFVVVENRLNTTLRCCVESAKLAGEVLIVLNEVDAGPEYSKFKINYFHLSTNSVEFELICFRRYFILNEYMKRNSELQKFVLIDSDILLFNGISEHIKKLSRANNFIGSIISYDEYNSKQISPHVSYWTREGIALFVDFLIEFYKSTSGRFALEEINNKFTSSGRRGGVSDMTLLYLWARSCGISDAINVVNDFKVIDHNFSISHNFLENEFDLSCGMKKIFFENNVPFFVKNNVKIKCLAIHFQGKAKMLMPYVLRKDIYFVKVISLLLNFAKKWQSKKYQIISFFKNK